MLQILITLSLGLGLIVGQLIRIDILDNSFQVIDVILFFQLSLFILKVLFDKNFIKSRPIALTFAIGTCWICHSILVGYVLFSFYNLTFIDFFNGILASVRFIFPLILFGIALKTKPSQALVLLHVLLTFALLVILFGIYQAIFLENFALEYGPENYVWDWQGNRLVSIFLDPNLAASFGSGIFILLLTSARFKIIGDKKNFIMIILSLLFCFLTLSRGGILGLFSGICIVFFSDKDFRKKISLKKLTVGVVILTFISISAINFFEQDFLTETNRFGADNESVLIRLNNNLALVDIFLLNPIFGVGFNYVRAIYIDKFLGFSGNYVDGGLLYLLASFGLVGSIFYSAFIFWILRSLKVSFNIIMPILIMFIIESFATSTIFYPLIMCYFALTTGFINCIYLKKVSKSSRKV